MQKQLKNFLDDAFKPYGDFPAKKEVMQELLANLNEKYEDLKREGMGDDEAYRATVDSFGNVAEIMEQVPHGEPQEKRSLQDLITDGVRLVTTGNFKSKFKATSLMEADLADTDLAGGDFSMSALMDTSFDRADLHSAKFRMSALKGASFAGANLAGAVFYSADVQDVNFEGADLTGTKFTTSALKGAAFGGAALVNTQFIKSDLSEVPFDGITLTGVVFDSSSLKNTTFKGATLHDVSFHHSTVKHTVFDGATMDKITYALLKGVKANLENVNVE